ncbi:MAG: hypothetical protein N3I35_08765 [Clostridia bacterium]|nr:hypothetical protein [Clostridia bacterium]
MMAVLRIIPVVLRLLILSVLWVVYLPINIMDYLWVRFVDPGEVNSSQEVIIS